VQRLHQANLDYLYNVMTGQSDAQAPN